MPARIIPGSGNDSKTRTRILDAALKLFAVKSYNGVSVRDICKVVGIKETTLYYHYKGKEALLEDIMVRFENGYRHYFEWLKTENESVESLEDLMDNLFNKEVLEMENINGCLGMSLVIKEQHNIESVGRRAFELFYRFSIDTMKEDIDRLIEKGIIPPADTKSVAMVIMNNIIVINDMRIHELTGNVSTVNSMVLYNGLKGLLYNLLKQKE